MHINPVVVDLSHHNKEEIDFAALRAAGVLGIIHKATQGHKFVDRKYAARHRAATQEGLLWGAFHYCTGDDPAIQCKHFLDVVAPDDGTLLAIDFEHNKKGTSMTLPQLVDMAGKVADANHGRKPVIYGGHYLHKKLNGDPNAFLGQHRLWLDDYVKPGKEPNIPTAWTNYWLWQFTDGKHGPEPHTFPNAGGNFDISSFNGSEQDLKDQWVP